MRKSKYQSLGIIDALFEFIYGFNPNPSKNGLYEFISEPSRPSRVTYSKTLYKLEQNGYIKRSGDVISLTDKGEEKALMRHLEHIVPPKKRDGFSRLIAFDIPEKMRSARDVMRQKLYDFECTKIQKSLYMSPYICEEEITEIARILKLQQHIRVFIISPPSHDRRKKEK